MKKLLLFLFSSILMAATQTSPPLIIDNTIGLPRELRSTDTLAISGKTSMTARLTQSAGISALGNVTVGNLLTSNKVSVTNNLTVGGSFAVGTYMYSPYYLAAGGSQTSPSYSFLGETTTGMYDTGGILQFATSGVLTAQFQTDFNYFYLPVEATQGLDVSGIANVTGYSGDRSALNVTLNAKDSSAVNVSMDYETEDSTTMTGINVNLTTDSGDMYGVKSQVTNGDVVGNMYGGYFVAANGSENEQYGVYGSGGTYGVFGNSSNIGVEGVGSQYGVYGYSSGSYGVFGQGTYGVVASGSTFDIYASNSPNYFAGNVGIGTTVTSAKLQVIGNALISGNTGLGTTGTTARLTISGGTSAVGNATIVGNVAIGTTKATDSKLTVSGTTSISGILLARSNVGIGTYSTTSKLTIAGGTSSTGGITALGNVSVGTVGSTSKLTIAGGTSSSGAITALGNVSVGTVGSTAKLTVAGGISATGNISATNMFSGGAKVLTTASTVSNFLPLAGGTMTGLLTATNISATGKLTVVGNTGLGTTITSAKLTVAGGTSSSGAITALGNVSVGTVGSTAKLTVAGTTNITGFAQFSSNVGIGTNSPYALSGIARTVVSDTLIASEYLHIGGSENAANSYRLIGFGYQNTGDSLYAPAYIGYKETNNAAQTSGAIVFGTRGSTDATVAGIERVRIDTAGNVAIATTSSTAKLTVAGGVSTSGNLTLGGYYAGNLGIGGATSVPLTVHAALGANTGVTFEHSNQTQALTLGYAGIAKGGSSANTGFTIDSAGTGVLSLNSAVSGNVSIGSTAASSKLSVSGGTSVSGALIVQGNTGIGTYSTTAKLTVSGGTSHAGNITATGRVGIGTSASPVYTTLYVSGNTSTTGNLSVLGNTGVGTSKGGTTLHVYNSTAGSTSPTASTAPLWIESGQASNIIQMLSPSTSQQGISFGSTVSANRGGIYYDHTTDKMSFVGGGNNTRMVIQSDGNIGIGTTTSAAKLRVSGNTSISGNLTVDGAGSGLKTTIQANNNYAGGEAVYANQSNSSGYGFFSSGGKNYLGGNTSIGTTASTAKLMVSGATSISANLTVGGKITGNLGLGTYAPGKRLEVVSNVGTDDGIRVTGDNDGANLWLYNTNTEGKLFRLYSSGEGNGIGAGSFAIYSETDGGSPPFQIDTSLNVYISGDGYSYGENGWVNLSDRRLKDNINPMTGSLDKVMKLNGVNFKWKENKDKRIKANGSNKIGLIAQDVQAVVPEVVVQNKDGYYGIAYDKLVPLLIESIKELNAKIDKLEKANASASNQPKQ